MCLIALIDSRIPHRGAIPILAFCQLTQIPLLVNGLYTQLSAQPPYPLMIHLVTYRPLIVLHL